MRTRLIGTVADHPVALIARGRVNFIVVPLDKHGQEQRWLTSESPLAAYPASPSGSGLVVPVNDFRPS